MDPEHVDQSNKPEPISPGWVHEHDAADTNAEADGNPSVLPGNIGAMDSPGDNEALTADTDRVVLRTPLPGDEYTPEVEISPVVDEITDQVRLIPVTEDENTGSTPSGETAPVATHSKPASADVALGFDEIEASQQQKHVKQFMGMSAVQRFFFFLFLLVIVVVLGSLFLALSGRVSFPFLMNLFP